MQNRSLWLKNPPPDGTGLLRFLMLPFLSSHAMQRLSFELLRWSFCNLGFNAPCKISSHKISSNCYNLKRRYSFICAYLSLHPNKLWGLTQRVVPLNPNSAKRAVGLMLTVFLRKWVFVQGYQSSCDTFLFSKIHLFFLPLNMSIRDNRAKKRVTCEEIFDFMNIGQLKGNIWSQLAPGYFGPTASLIVVFPLHRLKHGVHYFA